MKKYIVKEHFRTIQGEGHHAGTPALFIRFSSCNMWNGRDEDRARDSHRNDAHCPKWCDTDFVGGESMTAQQIAALTFRHKTPLVVLTGGEPLLQVDTELLGELFTATMATIAIETNGTVYPDFRYPAYVTSCPPQLWVTLSPKRRRSQTKLPWASELKLVWPDYDPTEWEDYPATQRYLQPRAGRSTRDLEVESACAAFVAGQSRWRISLQQHKVLGLR